MSDQRSNRVGVVFGSLTPPEQLAEGAVLAEGLGFGEVWFSEDCFFTGGVSGLTQLLTATTHVPAGLGLASVVTRHPAVLAMELAGLARTHPGRVRAAVGLGNGHWLEQMGVLPSRPLTAVRETHDALRELLSGAVVDRTAGPHAFRQIQLEFVPSAPPELWIGAVNGRALQLAGAAADGVLLSVLTYLDWAKSRVGDSGTPITTYVLAAVDDDPAVARDAVREAVGFFLRAESHTALVQESKHGPEVLERLAGLAPGEALAVEDHWIDEYAAAGTPQMVVDRLEALLAGGSSTVALWLFPPTRLADQLRRVSAEVLPHLSR
ncbi:LLM class flavin-dependent oxidoreductase [Kribbella sp. NPDC003557]|uniref:LLM class flavin-dependent oxidoreductase n=1 Tax=Kribbella sp. NPDC003557 TaxID=3154449 RepID=UPI0033B4857B